MPRSAIRDYAQGTPVATALAIVGGCVDGVGFLALYHLFTAHMSGNTTLAGIGLGKLDWGEAFRVFFPIPVFVVGVTIGAVLTESLNRRGVRTTLAAVLSGEALLLTLFTFWGMAVLGAGIASPDTSVEYYALVALPSLAMGMQNAAMRRVGGPTTRTTFITGTLTSVGEEMATVAFWFRDRTAGRSWHRWRLALRLAVRQPAWVKMASLLTVWCGYLIGAGLGTLAELHWGLLSLLLPLGGLVGLIAYDLFRPVARVEQRSRAGAS